MLNHRMHVAIADCAKNRLQIVTICSHVSLSASISSLDHVTSTSPSVTHLVLNLNIAITGSDIRGATLGSGDFRGVFSGSLRHANLEQSATSQPTSSASFEADKLHQST